METKMNKVLWRDLYEFIKSEIKKDPAFLDNQLMIECQDPKNINQSFKTEKDSEGWVYTEPAWLFGKESMVLTTRFPDQKIVTLNINY